MKPVASFLRRSQATVERMRASHILRQTGWLAVAKIVQGAASLIASLIVARKLGPESFGELSLAISIASFAAAAASLGLEQIATRELSSKDGCVMKNILAALWRLRIFGAITGCAILLCGAILSRSWGGETNRLLWILCLLPLCQIGDVVEWRLISSGQSRAIAIVTLAVAPAAAIARIAFALLDGGAFVFAWMLLAEWAIRSMLLLIVGVPLLSSFRERNTATFQRAVELLRESFPLMAAGIATFVYMRIDQFMIGTLLDARSVGLYSAVVTLSEGPLVISALLLRGALPMLTRQFQNDYALCTRTMVKFMRRGFFLHLTGAIILALLAKPIIYLFYGEAYASAIYAFRIQVFSASFVALGVLSSAWLILNHHTSHALRRTLLGAVVNVALNTIMIPLYGITGAAASTVIAQIFATYLADFAYPQMRSLFWMKTFAMLPAQRNYP